MKQLIAIINDDPAFLEFISSFLEEESRYRTVVWNDGVDALPKLRAHRPDAIILDVRLGDQPVGYEILRSIRRDSALRDTPIIMCTADTGFLREHCELLQSLEVQTLEKPFDLEDLERKVETAVGVSPTTCSNPDPVS